MDKQRITEEMGLEKDWYRDAKNMSYDKLKPFLDHLFYDFEHDYGTMCHAIAAASIATASAFGHSHIQGPITGYQASIINMLFVKNWMSIEGGFKILKDQDMLYPQYDYKFNSITQENFQWLVNQAKLKLEESNGQAHAKVLEHWESIAEGNAPFGLKVLDESK